MTALPFLDIHCHILPGVDDGPDTLEQSLAMARAFVAGGVGHVFATPHHIAGTAWSLPARQVQQRVVELQSILQANDIPLILHPGMEIALHPHLARELENEHLLPLGTSNCYLLEPPFEQFNDGLIDIVLAFKNSGRSVILAHPERIPFFQKNVTHLDRLIEQGILIQVNLGSLLGKFGKRTKNTALYLLRHNSINFAASDSHGPDVRKPPTIKDWHHLEQVLGPDLLQTACIDNPAGLIGSHTRE
jgi:protein-tyrosine phosphatase